MSERPDLKVSISLSLTKSGGNLFQCPIAFFFDIVNKNIRILSPNDALYILADLTQEYDKAKYLEKVQKEELTRLQEHSKNSLEERDRLKGQIKAKETKINK